MCCSRLLRHERRISGPFSPVAEEKGWNRPRPETRPVAQIPLTTPLAHLRAWCLRHSTESDAELLRRFVAHRDAVAFEQLVDRYSSLVWGVCRRILPCE